MKLLISFLMMLTFGQGVLAQDKTSDKPNIIFILVDDQRYDELGFMGHPFLKTPAIDALANKSVYFDQAFVTTSLCSPSRASIVTGQYTHTHGVTDNDTDLSPQTPTYAKELQKNGYKTGFVGKWHMGAATDERRPGFDYWVSFNGQGQYLDPKLNVDGERSKIKGHMTDILTDLAVDFIKKQASSDQPYMLSLSHKAVHENFTPTERHHGVYKDEKIIYPETYANTPENNKGKPEWVKDQRVSWHGAERNYKTGDKVEGDDLARLTQLYAETMLGVDDSVGKIVKTLKDMGQLDNTVIIYYSDNGYLHGEHGLIDKRVMYEESIRVPGFIHWPAKIKKASINSEFVLNIDLAPTILDIAGIDIPATMQGKSFLPLAMGKKVKWRQDFLYEYFVDPAAVQTPSILGLRTKDYSYMTYSGVWDIFELYDLQKDPQQMNNLLGSVEYGMRYGTFLRHAKQQLPKLAPTLMKLDKRLNVLLNETKGRRQPKWSD